MHALVVGSLIWRVERFLSERKIAESLLRLGYDVFIWCPNSERDGEIHSVEGTIKISRALPDINPQLIFWVTGYHTTPLPVHWLDKPIFYFVCDWYANVWQNVYLSLEAFLRLRERGVQVHFITVSPYVAEKIKEANPSVILGRVSDEVFLFPEELCVKKTPAPLISWLGNDLSGRTSSEVWIRLIDSFPDITFFFSNNTDPPFPLQRNCVLRKDLSFLKSLQIMYRSAALVAPYIAARAPHIPFCNPIKYWDSVALNTPVVIANVLICENMHGAHTIITEDAKALTDFFVEKVREIVNNPAGYKPFSEPQELREWRVENNFTRNLAKVMMGVLGEKWEFPLNLRLLLS